MLILQSRSNRSRRGTFRRLIWIAIPFAVAAAWLSWTPAIERYHLWKQHHALQQARGFIAQHDAGDAQLALEVAFTVAPGNIDAWRTAADMLEQAGTPETVRIRHHITQMMGATLSDQLALVKSALRFRDYNAARDALSSIPKAQATDPAALGAALSFALATENNAMADILFERLKKAMPNADDFKVEQAMLHLRHPNKELAAAARSELEGFAQDPKYALRVDRELMADAMLRRDLPAAKRWSAAATADPHAALADLLQQANLDLLVDKKPFDQVFSPLAAKAGSSPETLAIFVRWLLVQNRTAEAERWLAGLAAGLRNSPEGMTAEAEVAVQRKDWDRLASLLEAGAWGPITSESVRLAMSAKVVGSHNQELQHQVWSEAIKATNGSLSGLLALQRLTNAWKWDAESEKILWTIAREFPDQTWADEELFTVYRTRKDASNMREVMNILRSADQSVPRYQHDWALLTLLVDPTPDWNEPKEIMQRLYQGDPANPAYATGYAFALAQAGKGPQALSVVSKLSPLDREFTPRSPYLAYVYGLNRMKPEVAQAEAVARNTNLLPEERVLFTLAHQLEMRKPAPPAATPKAKPAAS